MYPILYRPCLRYSHLDQRRFPPARKESPTHWNGHPASCYGRKPTRKARVYRTCLIATLPPCTRGVQPLQVLDRRPDCFAAVLRPTADPRHRSLTSGAGCLRRPLRAFRHLQMRWRPSPSTYQSWLMFPQRPARDVQAYLWDARSFASASSSQVSRSLRALRTRG